MSLKIYGSLLKNNPDVLKQSQIYPRINTNNLDFSNYSYIRYEKISNICKKNNIKTVLCDNDLTLLETKYNLNNNKPFKQFGSFFKHTKKIKVREPSYKKCKFVNDNYIKSLDIKILKKLYVNNNNLDQHGGRNNGLLNLNKIKNQKKYNIYHDRLDYETTHLSAYLNLGCLSVREVYYKFVKELGKSNDLIKQLYWRDFYLSAIRFLDNAMSYSNYIDPRFNKLKNKLKPYLKRGIKEWNYLWNCNTGFLLVDATMKQLLTTGFCHNRGRLILGFFWIKYLMINMFDLKYGSHSGFSRLLLDAIGTSQNKMNHHWILDFDYPGRRFGKGISGRPFDISNINIKKYDPQCKYIKKWLPEFINIQNNDIYKWNKQISEKYNNLHNYPIFDSKIRYNEWKKITSRL